jgi:hypothetical protein
VVRQLRHSHWRKCRSDTLSPMVEGGQVRRTAARLRLRPGGSLAVSPKIKAQTDEPQREIGQYKIARLGVLSTLAVAVPGAVVTIVVTLVTASNQRDQSAEDFRRTQRQATFSDFITTANEYYDAENAY